MQKELKKDMVKEFEQRVKEMNEKENKQRYIIERCFYGFTEYFTILDTETNKTIDSSVDI